MTEWFEIINEQNLLICFGRVLALFNFRKKKKKKFFAISCFAVYTIYSTAQVVFQNPPRTGGVDFLAHHGSSWYPTPIPTATDFSSTAFPPSSLRKTTHLPVELCGGQKLILSSSQWKISDVRMIDSSEFFRVCMGRKSEPLFCLRITSFGWFAAE